MMPYRYQRASNFPVSSHCHGSLVIVFEQVDVVIATRMGKNDSDEPLPVFNCLFASRILRILFVV